MNLFFFGSSWIWLQASGTGRRIARKSAVVLSQACGNGVYPHFSEDTCPAVPAQETAATSTCCASLKACPSISAGRSHIRSPRSTAAAVPWRVRGLRKIALRVS
ncbi:MAG TPA: hypothetical protein VFQ76_02930 [Longimicrobiaceae bacterium]|nr:hypothetical protein [Longimicrobiaceae bacterium]